MTIIAGIACIEAWYRDGHTAVITAATTQKALRTALEADGLIAVFQHSAVPAQTRRVVV